MTAARNPKSLISFKGWVLDVHEVAGAVYCLLASLPVDCPADFVPVIAYHIARLEPKNGVMTDVSTLQYQPDYEPSQEHDLLWSARLCFNPSENDDPRLPLSCYVVWTGAVVITCVPKDPRPLGMLTYVGMSYTDAFLLSTFGERVQGFGVTQGCLYLVSERHGIVSVWQRPGSMPEVASAPMAEEVAAVPTQRLPTTVLSEGFNLYLSGRTDGAVRHTAPFVFALTKVTDADAIDTAFLNLSQRILDSVTNYDPRWAEESMDASLSLSDDDMPSIRIPTTRAGLRLSKKPSAQVGTNLIRDHLELKVKHHSSFISFLTELDVWDKISEDGRKKLLAKDLSSSIADYVAKRANDYESGNIDDNKSDDQSTPRRQMSVFPLSFTPEDKFYSIATLSADYFTTVLPSVCEIACSDAAVGGDEAKVRFSFNIGVSASVFRGALSVDAKEIDPALHEYPLCPLLQLFPPCAALLTVYCRLCMRLISPTSCKCPCKCSGQEGKCLPSCSCVCCSPDPGLIRIPASFSERANLSQLSPGMVRLSGTWELSSATRSLVWFASDSSWPNNVKNVIGGQASSLVDAAWSLLHRCAPVRTAVSDAERLTDILDCWCQCSDCLVCCTEEVRQDGVTEDFPKVADLAMSLYSKGMHITAFQLAERHKVSEIMMYMIDSSVELVMTCVLVFGPEFLRAACSHYLQTSQPHKIFDLTDPAPGAVAQISQHWGNNVRSDVAEGYASCYSLTTGITASSLVAEISAYLREQQGVFLSGIDTRWFLEYSINASSACELLISASFGLPVATARKALSIAVLILHSNGMAYKDAQEYLHLLSLQKALLPKVTKYLDPIDLVDTLCDEVPAQSDTDWSVQLAGALEAAARAPRTPPAQRDEMICQVWTKVLAYDRIESGNINLFMKISSMLCESYSKDGKTAYDCATTYLSDEILTKLASSLSSSSNIEAGLAHALLRETKLKCFS